MAERKTTPNIMGVLLGEKPEPAAKQVKPPKQRASISVMGYPLDSGDPKM